jgi:outer membrane protein
MQARGLGGLCFATGLAALVCAGPARATDWTVTIGLEGRAEPTYEGSDNVTVRPIPLIDIRRAGSPWHFQSARDGASIGVWESANFRFGVTGKIRFPRKQNDDPDLTGLGNVGWAFEPGAFLEWWPTTWLRTRGEVRQGFGGHHGQFADFSADLVAPVSPRLTLSAGPRLGLASADALDPYFGVTPGQSAGSGLPVFSPSGGFRNVGFGGQARYEFSRQWASYFYAEYDRLLGDVADSTLVRLRGDPNQVRIGIGVSYSFDVGLF